MPDSSARHAAWDQFIDALDRAGQAGSAANVEVPAFAVGEPTGKRFGELTRIDVQNLGRVASSLGRRADVVQVLWEDMQRKIKKALKEQKEKARKP